MSLQAERCKINSMPLFLYKLYSGFRLSIRIYSKIRWQLCPFIEIEKLIPKQANIIDVGCGFGLLSNYLVLMSKDRKVLGIDFSRSRIDVAKKTVNKRSNIDFMIANVKDLTLSDCDIVVMTDFLHHISFDQQEKLLRQVALKLKMGGRLILQDIDAGRSLRYFFTRLLDRVLNIGSPLFFRNKKSWEMFLYSIGFNVKVFHVYKFFVPDLIFICEKRNP